MHECPICKDMRVWLNLGQFSQCQGCKVVGTNSDEMACACGVQDYLYTMKKASDDEENEAPDILQSSEAQCANCITKGTTK